MTDHVMLAKILRRTGERVLCGWAQYHPFRSVGEDVGCLVEHVAVAYREITGSRIQDHADDHVELLRALARPIRRTGYKLSLATALPSWNDTEGRQQEEVADVCFTAARRMEAGA